MDQRRWEEIQAAFDSLVELDVAQRGNQLTALGSTDPELREAVEALLAADSEASARLGPLDTAFLPQSATAPDPLGLGGRAVAHFQVHEAIGAGGMGVVYRAEDTRLGRPVALKFLSPAYAFDAVARARFLREAHSAASLDHPNLCTVHEVGTSDDGRLFLAMALYSGETLRARLTRDGALPMPEVLQIARQIAEGLQAAHAAGIVHRDLKPGNVMLLPDGSVKILDFGLAKMRDQSLSETGSRLGTVSYMAPEQIRGRAVDGRADLWSLGVVLYEMLTNRSPFDSGEQIAIANAILTAEPTPPSGHRRDVPAFLEDITLRLMQKDPARRYDSASGLLRDLARSGTATAGAGASLRRRLRRVRRMLSSSTARSLLAGLAIVSVGGGTYAALTRRDASSAAIPARTAIAVLPFRNLSADSSHAYFVGGLQDEILTQLYKIPALKVIGRSSVMSYGGPKTLPLQMIARELRVGSVVDASVQVVGTRVRVNVQLVDAQTEAPLWVERYDRTLEDAFALQSDIARQIVATVGVVLGSAEQGALAGVPTQKAQAYLLYLQAKDIEGRPGRKRGDLEAAARLYQKAIALDSGFALAHAALSGNHAWMYILRYDMTPARLARQRAEAETAVRLAPNLPEARRAMGAVYNVGPNANPHAAMREWQLALRHAPNDSRLLAHTAAFYRQTGNWEAYEKAFQKVVELDPRNVDFLADYGGDTHVRMGRFADAIRWYDRAASLVPDTLGFSQAKAWIHVAWKGDMRPIRAWMNGEPGRVFRRNGWIYPRMNLLYLERQADSLLQLLEEARQPVFQSAFQFEPVALWSAAAHELRGDRAAARAAYASALVLLDSAIRKLPDDASLRASRGLALAGLGRRAEALEEVRRIRATYLFKHAWIRDGMLLGIARIHALLGDAEAAVDDFEEVLSQRHTGFTTHILRFDPAYDPVRRHPRFQALLRKYASHPNLRS